MKSINIKNLEIRFSNEWSEWRHYKDICLFHFELDFSSKEIDLTLFNFNVVFDWYEY